MTSKKISISRYNYLIISILTLQNLSAQVSNQATLARISEAEIQLQEKYMEGIVSINIGKMDAAAKAFQTVLDKNPKCDGCFFQLSRIASITGESQKALDFAKKAAAIDDRNKWYKMALAEAYEKQGKDREAADIYRFLTESAPFGGDFNDEIYFRLAYSHVRMAEPQKAIKVLDDLEKKQASRKIFQLKK
ncbi:MAG: tetratricopeptide repeat protein [Saprospiraceae bacterium]|nr:tetratricopeptide repeat protein [Saprospiraceae bacterium]